jgi:hypothetical protein
MLNSRKVSVRLVKINAPEWDPFIGIKSNKHFLSPSYY